MIVQHLTSILQHFVLSEHYADISFSASIGRAPPRAGASEYWFRWRAPNVIRRVHRRRSDHLDDIDTEFELADVTFAVARCV